MTNNQLLEKYYNQLSELLKKFGCSDDCIQMFWLDFLQKDNNLLTGLDERGEMIYYCIGWIKIQINSNRSTYYNTYRKYYDRIISYDDDGYRGRYKGI